MLAETDFNTLPLAPGLIAVVKELGFERLTPIQAATIPALLLGKDLVGQSKTGSGKTAAFALPILQRLSLPPRELGALVLCPTRELSAQVAREFRKLGRSLPGLSVVVLAGGQPLRDQVTALEKGVHLAVGTPGRVLDHLRRRTLKVHRVATVVLDEADRMLEMGFTEDMTKILKALPATRQTVFFSATFSDSIEALSKKYQRAPIRVHIEQQEQQPDIRQLVVHVASEDKLKALAWTLEQHMGESALVFTNLKARAFEIEKALSAAGVSASSLHGDLEQYDRDRVLAKFRNGSTRVLVATDVAARGIDLDKLGLVVNFDLPSQPELYVHRIGRTGRAESSGIAVSFCARAELPKLEAIERYVGAALTPIQRSAGASKSSPSVPQRPGAGVTSNELEREAKMDTLRLSGGRKEKLRPGDILGALTGEAGGLAGEDVGKIEIHERFAYVAVKKSISARALRSLSEGRIKGKKFRVELVK